MNDERDSEQRPELSWEEAFTREELDDQYEALLASVAAGDEPPYIWEFDGVIGEREFWTAEPDRRYVERAFLLGMVYAMAVMLFGFIVGRLL